MRDLVPHGAAGVPVPPPVPARCHAWPLRDCATGASHTMGVCGAAGMSGVGEGNLAKPATRGVGIACVGMGVPS